jgi:PhnB protein
MSTNVHSASIQPYLMFDGRCDEALEFYKKALGIKVEMLMRFKDSPDTSMCTPESLDKVMHASFTFGNTTILASDGRCTGKMRFEGFSLTLNVTDEATAKKLFTALSEGGQVVMPLTKTFFSPCFGMVTDKFGVSWMVHMVSQMS